MIQQEQEINVKIKICEEYLLYLNTLREHINNSKFFEVSSDYYIKSEDTFIKELEKEINRFEYKLNLFKESL